MQREFTTSFHCAEQHKKLDAGTRAEKSLNEASTYIFVAGLTMFLQFIMLRHYPYKPRKVKLE